MPSNNCIVFVQNSYAQIKSFWPFGELFCKIWITIDDVATMASVLSIVAITIERYWSINHSVHYRRYTTKARIRLFSLLIWLIPFLNFAPGIWLLKAHDVPQLPNRMNNLTNKSSFECIGAYHSNTLYLIVAQINFCAWPLVVIIVLNGLIVVNLYKRSHRFPAFASFRVPIQKQSYRKNTLREPFRQKLEEEQDQRQQQHLQQQQINNNAQIETAVDESNCGISNLFDLEVNIVSRLLFLSSDSEKKDILSFRCERIKCRWLDCRHVSVHNSVEITDHFCTLIFLCH